MSNSFLVNRLDMIKSVEQIKCSIATRTNLEILKAICLKADSNSRTLTMVATDLDMSITARLPIDTIKGEYCISYAIEYKRLSSILNLFYAENLYIEFIPNGMKFEYMDTSVEMVTGTDDPIYDGIDFPLIPNHTDDMYLGVFEHPELNEAVKTALTFSSNNDIRMSLCGVNFKVNNSDMTVSLQATDTHRACNIPLKNVILHGRIFKPCVFINDVVATGENESSESNKPIHKDIFTNFVIYNKILKKLSFKNDTYIYFNNDKDVINHVWFAFDNIEICCRTIEANYPPFERIFSDEKPLYMTFNRDTLLGILQRLQKYCKSSDGKDSSMKTRFIIDIEKNDKVCKIQTESNKVKFSILCNWNFNLFKRRYNVESGEYEFTDIPETQQQSCINVDFLIDIVKSCKDDMITFQFDRNNDLGIVQVFDRVGQFVVMPMTVD